MSEKPVDLPMPIFTPRRAGEGARVDQRSLAMMLKLGFVQEGLAPLEVTW